MTPSEYPTFGSVWFDALADDDTGLPVRPVLPASVRLAGTSVGGRAAAVLAVVPDPTARFPRARHGEVGLDEGWGVATAVGSVVDADRAADVKRPIVIVVDVPSQAYGYVEELAAIHQSLAAAAHAVGSARLAGHPIVAVIVGKAISGAFLATGLQANRIVALDHDGVAVQVMGKVAAARITRRTVAELDEMAKVVPATAYDGRSFAELGAVFRLVRPASPSAPSAGDVAAVRAAVADAIDDIGDSTDLHCRLDSVKARSGRSASALVRTRVAAAWA